MVYNKNILAPFFNISANCSFRMYKRDLSQYFWLRTYA